MMTAAQMRAARALLGIDQYEAGGAVRGLARDNPEDGGQRGQCTLGRHSLVKVIGALNGAGVEPDRR